MEAAIGDAAEAIIHGHHESLTAAATDIQDAVAAAAERQGARTTESFQANARDIAAAIQQAARRGELDADEVAAARDNLSEAPLTAALVASGGIKMRQVVDPAATQSYEKALRERIAAKKVQGRELNPAGPSSRLARAPLLTRFVPEPGKPKGARRYRQPRFAGPPW